MPTRVVKKGRRSALKGADSVEKVSTYVHKVNIKNLESIQIKRYNKTKINIDGVRQTDRKKFRQTGRQTDIKKQDLYRNKDDF